MKEQRLIFACRCCTRSAIRQTLKHRFALFFSLVLTIRNVFTYFCIYRSVELSATAATCLSRLFRSEHRIELKLVCLAQVRLLQTYAERTKSNALVIYLDARVVRMWVMVIIIGHVRRISFWCLVSLASAMCLLTFGFNDGTSFLAFLFHIVE